MTESEVRGLYRQLTLLLIQQNKTITTMESCTSGQIASLLTDTEGSSAVIKGAFVTYSNEAKIRQGVPAEVIESCGVYSKETARAMAEVCRKTYGADFGIGVTGSMGNVDPNNGDSVPGQIYFAIAAEKETADYFLELPPLPSRLIYKLQVAGEVGKVLLEMLGGNPDDR